MSKILLILVVLASSACTTLNESVQLGAGLGVLTGVAATHATHSNLGKQPSSDNVRDAAAIGMVAGLITSYFTHKHVEKNRFTPNQGPELHFGDLPPNPFLVPQSDQKGTY